MLIKDVSMFFHAQFYPQMGKPAVSPEAAADQRAVQPANRQKWVWMIAFAPQLFFLSAVYTGEIHSV